MKYMTEVITDHGIKEVQYVPCAAFYVPERQVTVIRCPGSRFVGGCMGFNFQAFVGPDAEAEYRKIREKLEGIEPDEIDAPESFVDWARKLYESQNPPSEIIGLLFL